MSATLRRPLAWLAITASLLLAWTVGAWQGGWFHPPAGNATHVADRTPPKPVATDREIDNGRTDPWDLAATTPRRETLRLSIPSGQDDAPRTIDIPLLHQADFRDGAFGVGESAIPDDVQRALSRSGYRVHQVRRVLPVQLDDGRRVVVPIDTVEAKYEGPGLFQ